MLHSKMQKDSSLQSARQRTIFLLDSIGWSHESDRQNTKFYGQSNLFSRSNPMKELNFEQMAAVEGGGCGLNMLAGAMIGGAVGGAAGAIGGAAVMGVLCLFH